MLRFHLIELEDQSWFPAVIRDLATDYLHFIETALKLDGRLAPLVARALTESGTMRIVDLCSGGSGPVPSLVRTLNANGVPVTATLTDLYPNITAFEEIAKRTDSRVTFATEPVDARAVPPSLTGLRTIFNGFHHLRPEDARSVLHAAAAARQPIAIFEISERSPRTIPVVLTPLMVWLVTPFMRPFLWRRLLWTYLIPLVPLTCLWDGIVSQLRAYTLDELRGLAAGSAPMRWDIGQVPFARGRGRLTYLIGVPA
ncbi:MAG TPA: hypothetical protein VH138_07235 [Vicinamibacterales bacterium]|nr:hypothetical protein [Vicinamibacterales bacterium]